MCCSYLNYIISAHRGFIDRCFSVGVTTAFGIILRLDKLMVATKELVGEQYHIHGIGIPESKSAGLSPVERPSKDV